MPRASICICVDLPEEVETARAWFEKWRSELTYSSENYGCGCCVDIFDVEAPRQAIDELPASLLCHGDWMESGIRSKPMAGGWP